MALCNLFLDLAVLHRSHRSFHFLNLFPFVLRISQNRCNITTGCSGYFCYLSYSFMLTRVQIYNCASCFFVNRHIPFSHRLKIHAFYAKIISYLPPKNMFSNFLVFFVYPVLCAPHTVFWFLCLFSFFLCGQTNKVGLPSRSISYTQIAYTRP